MSPDLSTRYFTELEPDKKRSFKRYFTELEPNMKKSFNFVRADEVKQLSLAPARRNHPGQRTSNAV